jgi:hypothetical protein
MRSIIPLAHPRCYNSRSFNPIDISELFAFRKMALHEIYSGVEGEVAMYQISDALADVVVKYPPSNMHGDT